MADTEFKLTLANTRKALNQMADKVGAAKGDKIRKVAGHPLAMIAMHARIRHLAGDQKFGTFQDFIQFLLDNQDKIMAFVKMIMALFGIAAILLLVLSLLAISASGAQATDCPCGPACKCTAPCQCDALGNVAGEVLKTEAKVMGNVLDRVTHPLQVDPSAGWLRKGQARRWNRQAKRGK